jgi:adenosylmethionine---8-amino-7-oxononanoate aminotransferase
MHGYHGDTFGAMAVCDPVNSMHSLYKGILPDNYFIKEPNALNDKPFDPSELDELSELLECRGDTIAALILEPVVQGAGGMRFYHPEFVSGAKRLCEEAGILLIADEIATGFGRTGKMFACEHANITPDIMCVGKGITGGYMSLAATMCTTDVALAISESEASVLMHGPTFMGNPLACSAANASLKLLKTGAWQQQVANIEAHLKSILPNALKQSRVTDVRFFGAIGVIELNENVNVASIQAKFVEHGVWIRPFGKLIYIMPPYVITNEELEKLTAVLLKVLELEFA